MIADGTQDALIVRVHTDEGVTDWARWMRRRK
jgi:phage baseplate assembly protein gpV